MASCALEYRQFEKYPMALTVKGNRLTATFGTCTLCAEDPDNLFPSGGAGYLVDEGAMFIDGFLLEREES